MPGTATTGTGDEPAKVQQGEPVVDLSLGSEPEVAEIPSFASLPCSELFSLAHTGVIITGGGRGLGLCIATALLEVRSPFIYCLDILAKPVESEWLIAEETAKKYGGKLEYIQLDITDESRVSQTIKDIYERCPVPIEGFFGAAGIQQLMAALDYTANDFRKLLDVNVTGMFLTVQATAREMVKRKIKGSLVMTASMSGSVANKGLTCTAYNSSKAALLLMAKCTAAEWGPYGIRVNTLSPGYIKTALTDALLAQRPDFEEEWSKGSMLGRLSTPDEFRGPVIFLLSRASSFMTGSDLLVDGGHTAW